MSGSNGNGKAKKIEDLPLTLKQKKFAKAYLETGSQTKAGKIAGYKHPMQAGHATLRNVEKKSAFICMMDKAGLSDKKLFAPIKDALNATKTGIFKGDVCESDAPDHEVRIRAAEVGFKLRGRLKTNEDESQKEPIQVLIINYDKNSDSGPIVPTIVSGPSNPGGPVEIQDYRKTPPRP